MFYYSSGHPYDTEGFRTEVEGHSYQQQKRLYSIKKAVRDKGQLWKKISDDVIKSYDKLFTCTPAESNTYYIISDKLNIRILVQDDDYVIAENM